MCRAANEPEGFSALSDGSDPVNGASAAGSITAATLPAGGSPPGHRSSRAKVATLAPGRGPDSSGGGAAPTGHRQLVVAEVDAAAVDPLGGQLGELTGELAQRA